MVSEAGRGPLLGPPIEDRPGCFKWRVLQNIVGGFSLAQLRDCSTGLDLHNGVWSPEQAYKYNIQFIAQKYLNLDWSQQYVYTASARLDIEFLGRHELVYLVRDCRPSKLLAGFDDQEGHCRSLQERDVPSSPTW